jgi:FtsZ-binding cell division protein ZapB
MSDILDDLHEAAKQVINHRALGKAVGTILKASEEIKRLRDENERLTRERQATQSRGADPDPMKG